MTKINVDDFNEWLENPITLGVLRLIKDEATAYREMAAAGIPLQASGFVGIGEKYFTLINTAMVYDNLLENLTFENVFQSENDDNEVQTRREQTLN